MAELTNLTDRLAHLRDRKATPKAQRSAKPAKPSRKKAPPKPKIARERKFAADDFGLFVYSLLGVALLSQIILIVWLDLF